MSDTEPDNGTQCVGSAFKWVLCSVTFPLQAGIRVFAKQLTDKLPTWSVSILNILRLPC